VHFSAQTYEKKRLYASGSTVTLSVLSLHITITQTRPHLCSVVCWSTQIATAINNVLSQRILRSASCVVDVDWLKVWVHLVVKERDKDYADAHILFIAWIQMNSWTWIRWLPYLEQTDIQLGLTSSIAESGTATPCFLTAVYVQNYTAECIVVK